MICTIIYQRTNSTTSNHAKKKKRTLRTRFSLALGSPGHWLKWVDIATDVLFVLDGLVMINTGVRLNSESGELGANSFGVFIIFILFFIVSYLYY
jgi:hypothetical protein